ncbi:unnamed protein product, partial [Effrenium voratum]
DWSTQCWSDWNGDSTSVCLRVHKELPGPEQGHAMVMEAAPFREGEEGDFTFIRIASLRSSKPWKMGLFCFAPVEQKGCEATFHYFKLGPKMALAHDAEYPFLTEEKMLDWKLITTREKAGICNADSIEECFHVCSVVNDCKFFATHFAVNCRACLLFKNCQNRESQSLVQDDLEGGGDSVTQVESDFHMYDIFQMEQGDVDVDAEKNLVKNPSFTEGKNGWADLCPPMMYNGKNLTFGCKNSGIWDAVPKDVGGDTNAYHVKENCFQGSRGGFYQDVKTEMGYTYELTFKLIDGYFSKKKAKEEKAWAGA